MSIVQRLKHAENLLDAADHMARRIELDEARVLYMRANAHTQFVIAMRLSFPSANVNDILAPNEMTGLA